MPGQIAIESPAVAMRRQPLLMNLESKKDGENGGGSRRGSRMGEAAGDCAAVWCCCPCAAVHLVILAVYRVPTGLWRKKKRNRLLKKKRKHSSSEENKVNHLVRNDEEESTTDGGSENDVVELEKEMMDRFYGAGFWRTDSQRTDSDE